MIRLVKYISVLLFASYFVSCTPDPLEIDIPDAETKMVVYSQALPDQALVVALSKSFSALSQPSTIGLDSSAQDSVNNSFLNQFLVDNAIVTVTGPDYDDTLQRAEKGVFIAPFFPYSPGNSYQLTATDAASKFTVSSVTTTLPIVNFTSLSGKRGSGFLSDSMEVIIDYQVNDPIGENYYLVSVYSDSIPESDLFSFGGSANANSIAFSDREYPQGQLIREDKFFIDTGDTIVVSLTNISKPYFEYVEARRRSGNSFLSEPVSFPSNVTNGYGFFNIHFPSARIIELEK